MKNLRVPATIGTVGITAADNPVHAVRLGNTSDGTRYRLSWTGLATVLLQANIMRPSECITGVTMDEAGLSLVLNECEQPDIWEAASDRELFDIPAVDCIIRLLNRDDGSAFDPCRSDVFGLINIQTGRVLRRSARVNDLAQATYQLSMG